MVVRVHAKLFLGIEAQPVCLSEVQEYSSRLAVRDCHERKLKMKLCTL